MQSNEQNQPSGNKRQPRLRLPFEKKETDPGEWSYDHRAGLCITLILYLLVAIVFVWGKIGFGSNKGEGTILIDFPQEENTTELTPEQQELLRQLQEDFTNVRNLASNENAQFDSELRDEKNINANELYREAGELDDKMKANRDAYEEGLRREKEMLESRGGTQGNEPTTRQDTRVKGSVTVSFSFNDPVRTSVNLVVPAYRCEGGGVVVVNAVLDINGYVTEARVDRANSSSDDCMQTTAVNAARGSRFNTDNSAPSKHRGTITYIFIPQ